MIESVRIQPKSKKKIKGLFFKQVIIGYAFLLPTIVGFLIFTIIPLVMSFYLAFTDYNLVVVKGSLHVRNFVAAFENTQFLKSFLNIFIYAAISVPLGIASSLIVSSLVNIKMKGSKLFKILYYIPAVTGGVAVAFVWKWMFNSDYGLFNGVFKTIGLPTLKWLDSQSYLVMLCIVIVSVWSGIGGNMLIFLAALKGVSPELYEAAKVDGANALNRFWNITVPSIAPTLFFVISMSIIGAFQLFDLVYIMVPTGSMDYARTPVVMIHELGFTRYRGGYGTAMSLILFAVIMIFTFLFQRFMKEDRTV